MTYCTFHVDDSGAIEDIDEKIVNSETVLICKMYDDEEFNKLNDMLHSLYDFILNEKALNIFKSSKTIPFDTKKAVVLRREKIFGSLKKQKKYDYYQLSFPDKTTNECYNWINFDKSEVFAIDNAKNRTKISSHQQALDLIEVNKSNSEINYSFETKKVVFGKNFDSEIDLFKIPLYSWGVYVSERLKSKLEEAEITDIGFADSIEKLGRVWRPHFPIVEFEE